MKQNEFYCTICFENICPEDLSTDVTLLPCGHRFHSKCLKNYFKRQNEYGILYPKKCPNCSEPVNEKDCILLGKYSEVRPERYKDKKMYLPMYANYCIKL